MRRIILTTAIVLTLFGLLIILSPYLLRITGMDVPVKKYLISHILNDENHHIDAQNLHIGLTNLEILNITFENRNKEFQLQAEKIRFNFNFWDFWTNPKQPQKAVKTIYLYKPTIVLNEQDSLIYSQTSGVQKIDEEILNAVNEINSIGLIYIREGNIQWKNNDGRLFPVAQDISGRLDTKNFEHIELTASAKIFTDDQNNFHVSAHINIPARRLTAEAVLTNYSLSGSALTDVFNGFPVHSGFLNGTLRVENRGFHLDSTVVNGEITGTDFELKAEDFLVRNFDFNVLFHDNRMTISKAAGLLDDNASIHLKASTGNILKPEMAADISIESFPLSFFHRFFPEIPFNGSTADLKLHFMLTAGKPLLNGQLHSKNVHVFKDEFKDLQIYFNWEPSSFNVEHFAVNWHGLSVLAHAKYDRSAHHLRMNLDAFQHLGEHIVFNRMSGKIQKLTINFDYFTDSKAVDGNWDYSLARDQDTLLLVEGAISVAQNKLIIESHRSSDARLKAILHINDFLASPSLGLAKISNLPVELLTSAPVVKDVFNTIDTEISLTGTLNNLHGSVKISNKNATEPLFLLNTGIYNLLHHNKQIQGNIDLGKMDGRYDFVFNNQFLGGNFQFGKAINGELYIDITKQEQLYGQVVFDEFQIFQALTDSLYTADFRDLGTVKGLVEFSGTVHDPRVKGELVAEKFVFNDIGYFQAQVDFNADRTRIESDKIMISLNNVPVLQGKLGWALLNNTFNGSLSGDRIVLTDMLKALDVDETVLTGTGSYKIEVSGNPAKPHLDAELTVEDGEIQSIPFNLLQLKLTDIVHQDGNVFSPADHYLSIERFYMMQQGGYHLNALGKLPLNNLDEIDIVLNFDGDIFGLLHHWEPFFQDGASLVDLNLKVGGTADNIRIQKAELNIARGELWLRNVAKHIENISGRIVLKEGTNEIDFVDMTGSINGQPLFLNTQRNVVTENGKALENWFFKDLDLDFGVLAFRTTDGGLTLNIPGLMEENEVGKFRFLGKTESEAFYFAGPVRHPLAYGKIVAYDTRVTFPFLVGNEPGKKPSVAVQFLTNMDWDVDVRAGEDVLYFRDIPAYIDNVQAEVFMDESSEGLSFRGIIDDGTFYTTGSLISTRGRLEYLDQNFRVDHFNLEFNEGELFPDVSGRAWTSIRDSVGAIPKTIYLQLYVIDSETGQERESGNWEHFKFRLVSADPQIGETQEQVLAYMGYSVENIKEKATSVGGAMTEKYLIRPLLRPIERALERNLGMDMVRFNSSIAKNLFYGSIGSQATLSDTRSPLNPFSSTAPYLFLMQSSEVTLGKYLTQDIYLTYTGQLVSVYDQFETGFDFNHSFGLEYRFLRNILLEVEYDRELMGYYRVLNDRQYMEDIKIRLRHSFSF